jgi:hypothetical protein
LLLVVTAVLLAYFLIIGLLGWQSGQRKLTEAQATAVAQELAKQLELARSDMADGRYALAQERLSWVLARAPDHLEAQTMQQEAQAKLTQLLTPQPTQPPTPPPTETPLPTITPEAIADPEARFMEIEQLVEAEEWVRLRSGWNSCPSLRISNVNSRTTNGRQRINGFMTAIFNWAYL